MSRWLQRSMFAGAVLVASCNCDAIDAFCLSVERDCTLDKHYKPGGLCIFDGREGPFCAFPDDDCPSGYRWGQHASKREVCDCVAPEVLRAAADAGQG